jgi:hypothetical protein
VRLAEFCSLAILIVVCNELDDIEVFIIVDPARWTKDEGDSHEGLEGSLCFSWSVFSEIDLRKDKAVFMGGMNLGFGDRGD